MSKDKETMCVIFFSQKTQFLKKIFFGCKRLFKLKSWFFSQYKSAIWEETKCLFLASKLTYIKSADHTKLDFAFCLGFRIGICRKIPTNNGEKCFLFIQIDAEYLGSYAGLGGDTTSNEVPKTVGSA